jgi:hypothetical protein
VAIVEWATEDFTIKEIEQLGFAPTPADCATADLRLLPDYEANTAKGWIPHLLCGVSAQFYVPVATSKPEPESPCPNLSVNCQDPSGVL